MQLHLKAPSHATVVAYLALFVAMSGSAYAATGGTFSLGTVNKASHISTMKNPQGTPLSLIASASRPPLVVNRSTKVSRLNADLIDGLDSSRFQRATSVACPRGTFLDTVRPDGTSACSQSQIVSAPISNIGGFASCPAGTRVVGGGFDLPLVTDATRRDYVRSSRPESAFGQEGWSVVLDPVAANSYQVNAPSTVYAVCVG
jgi:hypothetical protein